MRILWLKSDYIAPADTGGKIRTYNLLRELSKRCHVTYASFRAQEAQSELPPIDECASRVITLYRPEENKSGLSFYLRILRGVHSNLPYIVQKYRAAAFTAVQREWYETLLAEGFQDDAVVVCDFLEMSENVEWPIPVPKVLFEHNVESMIWRRYAENERNPAKRMYFEFEHRRMKEYEGASCNKYDLVFAVSREDRELLKRALLVDAPIEVLETGVDIEHFAPQADAIPVPGRLLFLGSLDWMPNIDGLTWFVEHVYPLIRAQCPHVTLQVVGRRPTAAVQNLARGDSSIHVIGDVADVRPYVAQADLFVVPLRIGGGSRIKIYEAMAMRRPVVSTSVGAEGLPLQSGEHLAIGDLPHEFAARVRELLENDAEKERLAREGHRFVTTNYPWSRIARMMYAECEKLVRNQESVRVSASKHVSGD